jgi:hypothetical protein
MASRSIAVAGAALLALAACNPDEIVQVEDPDVLTPGALNTREALPTVRAGVIGNFQVAFSGGADLQNSGHEGQVNVSGLLADEYISAETFPDRIGVDQRTILPGNGSMKGVFLDLSRVRAFAEFASARYNSFPEEQGGVGHAEVLSLGGFTYVLFAENYCSGVPYSFLEDDGDVSFGEPLTRDETLERAVAKFDSALAFAAAQEDDEQLNLARVGRARALLDLARFAEAAAAVAEVPTEFRYLVEGSANSTRQNNGIWNYTLNVNAFGVPDGEGGNGLPFASDADPRVPSVDIEDFGFDGTTPFIAQQKYTDPTSDVVLAGGIEARLIEAEAALRGGDAAGAIATLNDLRAAAGPAPLGALDDPGTDAGRVDLLFRERAYWLYLTSHRLGDLRRLVRQYGRDAESVFPTGEYHKAGNYGTDVNFPISGDERNNPNFTECIDRSA